MRIQHSLPFIILALLGGALAGAQTMQDSGVKAEQTTSPDGHIYFVVTNQSRLPITAIAVTITRTSANGRTPPHPSVRYFDSAINPFGPDGREINPGQSHTFSLAGPLDKSRTEGRLNAVIFSDGSSSGDPEWVGRMVQSREMDYKYIDQALHFLQMGKVSGISLGALAVEGQRRMDAVLHSSSAVEEKQIAQTVYGDVILNLQGMPNGTESASHKLNSTISQLLTRRQRLLSSKPLLHEPEQTSGPTS